jgi:hypothetical protein
LEVGASGALYALVRVDYLRVGPAGAFSHAGVG